MTDKELLELAAKAAGYKLHIWGTKGEENVARMDTLSPTRWNPLTDDGDALRLAVKLGMWAMIRGGYTDVMFGEDRTPFVCEKHNDDPYAATRRAIVRAAAEIGATCEK